MFWVTVEGVRDGRTEGCVDVEWKNARDGRTMTMMKRVRDGVEGRCVTRRGRQ